ICFAEMPLCSGHTALSTIAVQIDANQKGQVIYQQCDSSVLLAEIRFNNYALTTLSGYGRTVSAHNTIFFIK
ncbi:MAG: hypothetical protein KDE53_12395, partial [Caldilineaceae bacterium]|nr:hypothetical protein [Caldilineaceae bacterium]